MKILVTGAGGFIGSHLVDNLVDLRHEVISVDDLSGGYKKNLNPKSKFYKLDLRQKEKTINLITKLSPSLIYHLAADATEGRSQFTPSESVDRNLNAYINVLLGAIKSKIKRIILTSSMSVYGEQKTPFTENLNPKPVDVYGVAKAAMEEITKILSKVHGFEFTILRPHNVYGPRQNMADPYRNVAAIFINRMLQKKPFYIYGNGLQKRSFSYIGDVAPYIAKAGFSGKTKNQILNIGPSKEYTVNELAMLILSHFVKDIRNVPKKLQPIYLPDRPQEVQDAYCTVEKARKLLNFKEGITLKQGISKMIAWAKKTGPQKFKYMKSLELESKNLPLTWKRKLI